MVWQYLNADKPKGAVLNVSAAIKFASGLGCSVSEFSPTIQEEIDRLSRFSTEHKGENMAEKKIVVAHVPDIPLKTYGPLHPEPEESPFAGIFPDLAALRGSSVFGMFDVKAACGDGIANADYPETVRTLVMSPSEARRLIGSTNKSGAIKVIVASKDSMVPTINPDDLLFVDTSVAEYIGEAVYILRHGGELVCKRLSLVGNTLTVSSDNRAYESWSWSDRNEETAIVGRVLRALPMTFKNFGALQMPG